MTKQIISKELTEKEITEELQKRFWAASMKTMIQTFMK